MFSVFFLYLIVISSNGVEAEDGLRTNCPPYPRWAPGFLKRPLVTLLSDPYCPSWMSRDFFTKMRNRNVELRIRKGLPMGLTCGFCVNPSSSIRPEISMSFESSQGDVRKVATLSLKSSSNSLEHQVRGEKGPKCYISYGQTGPIEGNGIFSCNVRFGSQNFVETAKITAHENDLVEYTGSIVVESDTVELTCPENPSKDKMKIVQHAWYYPNAKSSRVVLPSTDSSARFKLVKGKKFRVACASYYFDGEESTVTMTYEVSMKGAEESKLSDALIYDHKLGTFRPQIVSRFPLVFYVYFGIIPAAILILGLLITCWDNFKVISESKSSSILPVVSPTMQSNRDHSITIDQEKSLQSDDQLPILEVLKVMPNQSLHSDQTLPITSHIPDSEFTENSIFSTKDDLPSEPISDGRNISVISTVSSGC